MSELFSVAEKVVIITGGSGLLGTEFSSCLTDNGAIVCNFDLKGNPAVDISDQAEVIKATEKVIAEFGRIDVLVHAAAFNPPPCPSTTENPSYEPYEQYSLSQWRKELSVNLTSPFICTQEVAKHMMRQKQGSIIFIASDLAVIAPQNDIYPENQFKDIAYVSSKSGLLGLMRSWASYLGPHKIRVNALLPGGVDAGLPKNFVKKNAQLNMMNRMARKDEYNGAILFLASQASSYMTGSTMIIDGGRTAW